MLYNNVSDVSTEKINKRIKDAIKEWGTQEKFFENIHYTKQSFHKCVREHTIPPLDVLLEIARKLDCDIGYLLCEYDEKHHVVADIKKSTGLESDVINIILNMKDSFFKMSILNDLLQNNYFLAIINLLYMTDYHRRKGVELYEIEKKIKKDLDNAETSEEKARIEKKLDNYRTERELNDANVLAYRYRLTIAFSRLLDERYEALPNDTPSLESRRKQEHVKKGNQILF